MGAAIVLGILVFCLLVWAFVRLMIWIIKTAVKEALREYDAEKRNGPQ